MPDGSTFPHGNVPPATGSPRCARHCCLPLVTPSAYTESPSVATSTRPWTMRGSAYTRPSSAGESQAFDTVPSGCWSAATPWRVPSWWYCGHSAETPDPAAAGAVVLAADAALVGVVASVD